MNEAKKLGVEHVMFHKKRGMEQTEMMPSAWIYGELRRFRAGLEVGISYLKRCFELDHCRWSGCGRLPRVRALGSIRTQPDKAGSFAAELTTAERRLDASSSLRRGRISGTVRIYR